MSVSCGEWSGQAGSAANKVRRLATTASAAVGECATPCPASPRKIDEKAKVWAI